MTTLPARYESQASCAAATTSALLHSTGFDFPEIQAECRAVSPPLATDKRVTRPATG